MQNPYIINRDIIKRYQEVRNLVSSCLQSKGNGFPAVSIFPPFHDSFGLKKAEQISIPPVCARHKTYTHECPCVRWMDMIPGKIDTRTDGQTSGSGTDRFEKINAHTRLE